MKRGKPYQTCRYGIFPCDAVDPADESFAKTWVATDSPSGGGSWVGNTTDCSARGLSAMTIFKQQVVDKWESLGWLILFGCLIRLTTLFLKIVPPAKILHAIGGCFASSTKHDGW
jgi:hypothetical protein